MTKPVYDSEISRRTLAKGAVWSVPAIAIAAASPAAATSPGGCPQGVTFIRGKETCGATVSWTGKPGVEYTIEYQVHGSNTWHSDGTATISSGNSGSHLINASDPVVKVRVGASQCSSSVSALKSVVPTVTTANWVWTRSGPLGQLHYYEHKVEWTPVEGATSYKIQLRLGSTGLLWKWITISDPTQTSWQGMERETSSRFSSAQVKAVVCGKTDDSWYSSPVEFSEVVGRSKPVDPEVPEGNAEVVEAKAKPSKSEDTGEVSVKDAATEKSSSNKKPASKQEAPVVESTTKPEPTPTDAEVAKSAVETE